MTYGSGKFGAGDYGGAPRKGTAVPIGPNIKPVDQATSEAVVDAFTKINVPSTDADKPEPPEAA